MASHPFSMAVLAISCILLLVSVVCTVGEAKKAKGKLKVVTEVKSSHCPHAADKGDTIVVHYTGSLENGMVFDTSKQEGRSAFPVVLGAGQVIPGWEEGLLGICEGETRKLVIPPHLAYGEQGHPPMIPGDATLIFTVECVGVQKNTSLHPGTWRFLSILALCLVVVLVVYELYKRARAQEDAEKRKKREQKEAGGKKNRKRK